MSNKHKIFLASILLLAAVLRLMALGSDELTFDEGFYSFRSIGYLDYLESAAQTTPVQWLAPTVPSGLTDKPDLLAVNEVELPPWLKLSFHDHPPLFFLSQHIFFKTFGNSLLVSRLPSALAGVGSVALIFLIVRLLLKNETAGLAAAFLGAINFSAISVSRLGMMESVLIFFVLVNIYFFLKFLRDKKYWWQFGLTLGLAFLAKYVAFFLIPTYFVYLLIYRRDLFQNRQLYLSLAWVIVIFSPVIIYNIYSYKTFSHFDLQFGYLFGQELPWDTTTGGKAQEPFSNIFENLLAIYSLPFLIISVMGLALALKARKFREETTLMILAVLFTTLLLTIIGSAIRFVSLYIIPTIFFTTFVFIYLYDHYVQHSVLDINRNKKPALVLAGLFLAYETFFTINLTFINPPDYGVVKLDKYFDSVFGGGRSEAAPSHPNPYLNKVIQKYALQTPIKLTQPTGIIYDDNIALSPSLWLFSRRQYYQGIPIMSASIFEEKIKNNPTAFFGLELYFVKAEPASPLKLTGRIDSAQQVENSLKSKINPTTIKTSNDVIAFKVYKFSLKN